uniref:Uncharacterized protein n=1 Tax=Pyrodinium bahamense TaxID=73915 RepID=A0A7S0B282_9DINO|mmetsp:Transcript_46737/g.130109  ORF Transcript_46737/g.130109 Transcript_46737/m.130109 type:complete len:441 (+) Transcript_46737:119-1441(+)
MIGPKRAVPTRLRLGLPLLAGANAGLLVAAHLCKGASTQVDGSAPFNLLEPHAASDDNLISAIRRLAEAHVWFMVFIVAFLSGLWPYLKLLATVGVVALTDMGRLSKGGSYNWLCALETLGKYSFADVILICFNAVIFDVSTGGPYRILLFGQLELQIYMHLKFGSVALILGVTFSALLTHWAACELSPAAAPSPEQEGGAGASEESPLLPDKDDTGELQQEGWRWTGPATLVVACAAAAFLSIGAFMPMVFIERSGFLGKLIRPESNRNLELSILALTGDMIASAKRRNEGTVFFFAVLFVVLTLVAPLLELVAVAACGVGSAWPRSPWRRWARQAAEWFHSFGCAEVLLLVCLATLFEIQTVVYFNIGEECEPFEAIMDNKALLSIAGLGFAASKECFVLTPHLRPGWYVLLTAVLLRTVAWRLLLSNPRLPAPHSKA